MCYRPYYISLCLNLLAIYILYIYIYKHISIQQLVNLCMLTQMTFINVIFNIFERNSFEVSQMLFSLSNSVFYSENIQPF